MRILRLLFLLSLSLCAVRAEASPADDIAAKLATYERLLVPNEATYQELSDFIAQNPDWPQQSLLAQRREEALMNVTDPTTLLGACAAIKLQQAGSFARCAAAETAEPARRAADANEAWARGYDDPEQAASFLTQFGNLITSYTEWRRYTRELQSNPRLAAVQLQRLDPAQVQIATVLLAFHNDDPTAPMQAAALPAAEQSDPALFLAWSDQVLTSGDDRRAYTLWQKLGDAAQAADPKRLGQFWNARSKLARELLEDNDAADAYSLAVNNGQVVAEKIADAEFFAGWIALRKLNDPEKAIAHFSKLENVSQALITAGRAHYWLGRAYADQNDDDDAHMEYLAAARYPYVYYGQLAMKALRYSDAQITQAIRAAHDPVVDTIRANALAGTELARAAQLLVDQGNLQLARIFVQRLAATALDPSSKVAAAYLANSLGLPDQALLIARQAAVQGVVLPDMGWPAPVTPPAVNDLDPALTLAIIRQESNFDPDSVSPAGALGLMQLMPATARNVAHALKIKRLRISSLTTDPTLNLELGSDYLETLMGEFNDVVPFAVAAYNAGPDRVDEWRSELGDPAMQGGPDMIDWIEQIPFSETRNYVQRVIENLVIYRARSGRAQPHPLAQWLN